MEPVIRLIKRAQRYTGLVFPQDRQAHGLMAKALTEIEAGRMGSALDLLKTALPLLGKAFARDRLARIKLQQAIEILREVQQ